MGRKIGYARVSTVGQNIEAQVQLLEDEGCEMVEVIGSIPVGGTSIYEAYNLNIDFNLFYQTTF